MKLHTSSILCLPLMKGEMMECEYYRFGDDDISCSCHINPPCSTCVENIKLDICLLVEGDDPVVGCQGNIGECEHKSLLKEE